MMSCASTTRATSPGHPAHPAHPVHSAHPPHPTKPSGQLKPTHSPLPLSDTALVQIIATSSHKSSSPSRSSLSQIVTSQATKIAHYRSMIKVDRADIHGHIAGLPIKPDPDVLEQIRQRYREENSAGSAPGPASTLPVQRRQQAPQALISSTLWSRLGTYGFDDEAVLSTDIFSVASFWVVHDRGAPLARVYKCEDGQVYALHGGAVVRSAAMGRRVLDGLARSGRQFWITLGGPYGEEMGFEEVFKVV